MTTSPTRLLAAAAGCLALALAGAGGAQTVESVLMASGIPGAVTVAAPEGDSRLFVVERAGRIRVVQSDGTLLATPFLDIRSRVGTGGEGGLLGLAFPADYAQSGLFTVYYTDLNLDSVVSRFAVSGDPNVANANSEQELLFIDQPDGTGFSNHKGGTIHYGPDGFLWFATGDGGGANDPFENAQNPQSLLGKMLRIDVGPVFAPGSLPVAGEAYRIPADNPFVGSAPRDEIWALGLRNPFRWSFDRETGDIWIGDVGQNAIEEVDFESVTDPGGRNYGWDVMEGTRCNTNDPAPSPPCNSPSLTLPVFEYDHSAGRCTIIGGFRHRADFSPIRGLYFFGDFCTGEIWSFDPATEAVVDRTAQLGAAAGADFSLVSFGEDGLGRVLIVHRNAGTVHRIRPVVQSPPGGCGLGPELLPALAALAWLRRRSASAR
jgi:glucose/arabinose dehydrogenase